MLQIAAQRSTLVYCSKDSKRIGANRWLRRAQSSPKCLALAAAADTPGSNLARDFSKHVNETGATGLLQNRRPSHLLSPTAAIAAQLNALQLNDWPEPAAGIRTAYLFSKPYQCEDFVTGPALPDHARTWHGKEAWLGLKEFTDMLWCDDYRPLINCESWQATSPLVFPSTRSADKAVQTIEVKTQATPGTDMQRRTYTFTFCLEHILQGPYKGCWMTVGLRLGDYGNV